MRNELCIRQITDVFYLRTDRWERPQPRTRALDGAILFCEGEIEYYFGNTTVTARAGDLLLLPGNVPYAGRKLSRYVAFYVLNFECTSPTAFEDLGTPCAVPLTDYETIRSQFADALTVWTRRPIDSDLRLKSFAYSLLCSRFGHSAPRTASVTDDILAYVADNLHDSAMTVTTLCRRFYVSESQLRRNICKATGLNPNEYILLLRFSRAKSALLCTQKSVKQIAEDCGFASPTISPDASTHGTGCPPPPGARPMPTYKKATRTAGAVRDLGLAPWLPLSGKFPRVRGKCLRSRQKGPVFGRKAVERSETEG